MGTTNDGMQSLIGIVNQLQDAFALLGGENPLDLPQVCTAPLGNNIHSPMGPVQSLQGLARTHHNLHAYRPEHAHS